MDSAMAAMDALAKRDEETPKRRGVEFPLMLFMVVACAEGEEDVAAEAIISELRDRKEADDSPVAILASGTKVFIREVSDEHHLYKRRLQEIMGVGE